MSNSTARRTSMELRAMSAWDMAMPDWLQALARACDASGLRKIAARLGVSPTLVSLALSHKYHGPLTHLEARVRATLLHVGHVDCPVLGGIPAEQCRLEQQMPFCSTSPLRVQLYRACNRPCTHKMEA
ncbi:hypothetical protein DSECCO2_541510 [anaerobic digester metagenome]